MRGRDGLFHRGAAAVAVLLLAAACRQDMHDQPRYEPYEASTFFKDGRSVRPQVPGTVARGQLDLDDHLFRGIVDGKPAPTFPFPVTADVLARGRERYDAFCSACHDRLGYGQGPVVRRGLKPAASFHVARLREAPPGYFFDTITNGFGAMYGLSHSIPVRDRWAIVAYLRALQRSQNAQLEDVPPDIRGRLEKERP